MKLIFNLFILSLTLIQPSWADDRAFQMAEWTENVVLTDEPDQYYVSPDGKPDNPGTYKKPWDFTSAMRGEREMNPGSIIWIRGGTYTGDYEIKLTGTKKAPIHIRAYPGERATVLDSELKAVEPACYFWLWDLEIMDSVPVEKRETEKTGSHPDDLPGSGGINILYGKGCKFINLNIHDNVKGGVGWWVNSTDSEFHGCLIYNNGWRAPDRGHGHCIYAQNRQGIKTISSCIMTVPYDGCYTMHAYGSSRAYVDNFFVENNIAYTRGPFLIGGGRPSHNIKVFRNYLYGINMRIGYGAENEDCYVRDNIIAKGELNIQKYNKVVKEGNIEQLPENRSVLIPNKYDPNRAHLVVYNGAKNSEVKVDVSNFLKPGDAFILMHPEDIYIKDLHAGRCEGQHITIPLDEEFAVYVMLKKKILH